MSALEITGLIISPLICVLSAGIFISPGKVASPGFWLALLMFGAAGTVYFVARLFGAHQ